MSRNPVWWLLATASLMTAAIATQLIFFGDEPVPASPVSPDWKKLPFLPEPAVQSLALMEQTAARPLFRQNRRRPMVFAPASDVPEMPAPPISQDVELRHVLSAVVITKEQAVAYLTHPDTGLVRVAQGGTVDGWTLAEVRPDAVILKRGEQRSRLELRPEDPATGGGTNAGPLSENPEPEWVSERLEPEWGADESEADVVFEESLRPLVEEAPRTPQAAPRSSRTKRGPRPLEPEALRDELSGAR